jgi:hypothetical protein
VLSLPAGGSPARLLGQDSNKTSGNAEVSPDGRWVAYELDEPNQSQVFVESLRTEGSKWQISTAGGMEPHWRKDGKELFYIAGQKLMAVDVKTEGEVFQAGSPKALFAIRVENFLRRSRYQVAANGQRFLINLDVQPSPPFTVAINSIPADKVQ